MAVVLVVLLVVSVAGYAAWTAWPGTRNDSASGPLVDPPQPSTDADATRYPAELSRFYEQDLDWRRCGEYQCARLMVPLDYAKPGATTIELAVLRAPALRRGERVGQLVVNPGGPGGSGVDYAAGGPSTFGVALSRYFDIVGFDPRGVGESTPLACADTKMTDEFLSADPDPDTPAEVRRLDRLTREYGQGCLTRSGELARHMSTVEVVKDMDVLREALGERQLDYLGASYGTFIGATYAEMFPTRVRRMVLDGAIDPALSLTQRPLGQAEGFETALRAYLQDCVGRGRCVVGDSVDAGARRIKEFLEQVDGQPLRTSSGRLLTQALATYGIVLPLYVERLWPLLSDALQAAQAGNGDQLLQLADQYTSRGLNRYTDNSTAALLAVNCLDNDEGVTVDKIPSQVADFDKVSPTFGRIFAYGLSTCVSWPIHSKNRTQALNAKGAPPIVVIGTTRDPATPYRQSVALADQLESGVLISRDGDGHTAFQQGNRCVDRAVESYLVGGTVPRDRLSC